MGSGNNWWYWDRSNRQYLSFFFFRFAFPLHMQQQEPPRDLRACQLLWGDEESMKSCVQEEGAGNPDVLIGADIVCWPESILPLLLTLKALFHRSHTQSPPPALYLGFVCRATSTKDRLAREAKELGLVIENIPLDSFLPSERPPEVQSLIPLEIFKLFLDPGSQRAREPVCFSEAVMPKSLACWVTYAESSCTV